MSTVYLITGGNRGIGRGLVEALLQRPNTTVIAGVRDPSAESSKSIKSVKTGADSKAIVVRIDSTDEKSAEAAVSELKSAHGITKLDVVIANAGIASYYGLLGETPLKEIRQHFEVNVIGPVALFQATIGLLEKSQNPKFIAVSSAAGSITDMEQLPMKSTAYGGSKAALNFIIRKGHFEYPNVIIFPISPGWVQTEMGNFGAASVGMDSAPVTLDESISGILDKIDNATREKTSGTLVSYEGKEYNW